MKKLYLIYIFGIMLLSCSKPESKIISTFENGNPQIEYIYVNGEKDHKNYRIKQYYHDGHIEMTGEVKDGKDDGEFIWYYQNGQRKSVENYSKGLTIDTTYCYYESGEIKRKVSPSIVNHNRKATEFYKSGEIKIITYIKNGEILDSSWSGYYKSGRVKEIGNIKEGKRIGLWTYYDSDGQVIDSLDLTGKKKSLFDFDVLK
jgi:antitoxin component YwqK of YwqJK toxin-antitoxin module